MRFLLLLFAFACASSFAGAGGPTEAEIATYGGAYFAPMSSFGFWRMRMPDGVIREFYQPATWTGGAICSADGWTGKLRGKGVTVIKGPKEQKPRLEWVFEHGTLRLVAVDGVGYGLDYSQPVVYEGEKLVSLWPKRKELSKKDVRVRSTWNRRKSKRLFAWFSSPNKSGAFFCFLSLIALGIVWHMRCIWCRVLFGAVGCGCAVLMLLTGSRGAVLAYAAGLAVSTCAVAVARQVRVRRLLSVGLGLLLLLGLVFAFLLQGGGIRAKGAARHSDRTRSALFMAAPRMFLDAPGGWGSRYVHVGAAYTNWYQPPDSRDRQIRFNLISDHLTRLVMYGWARGWAYVFAWSALLLTLFLLVSRGLSPVPLAVWTSFAVVPLFNLIYGEGIWIAPACSLLFLLAGKPWRHLRTLMAGVVSGAVFSLLLVTGIVLLALVLPKGKPMIHKDGPCLMIGGTNPEHWIVDDNESLGGISTGQDICRHFRMNPASPAIGYVQSVADLPQDGSVRHLTLAGEQGRNYLKRVTVAEFKSPLPKSIRFLSPTFPPSAIPDALRERVAIAIVIGEFAARYNHEYAERPRWVSVVKGAEVYLPRWVEYAVK